MLSEQQRTVWWEAGTVVLIDQRLLPAQHQVARCTTLAEVAAAIKLMQVRGAPAIGCTAAYGMALVAAQHEAAPAAEFLAALRSAKAELDAQRPTAVNLAWATHRMLGFAEARAALPGAQRSAAILAEAEAISAEDLAMCHAIGQHGAPLVPPRGQILTHCNAGGLATAGYGTALGVIRAVAEAGRPLHVFVDETRPFLQGARLTAWELQQAAIAQTLITDNMAGHFMQRGAIDCVVVGADRIVANGDTANKIGTYSLAVLANYHQIPFYVAAPTSTLDLSLADGSQIAIEERAASEVTTLQGVAIAPLGVKAAHPAFDVTPAALISAIITERGVVYPPFAPALRALMVRPTE